MLNSKIVKEAHEMAREIKAEYPEVNYQIQFGLCLSYLLNKGEVDMEIKSFTVFTDSGVRGTIKIGNIEKKVAVEVYVKELKFGSNIIKEDCVAYVGYNNRSNYPVLQFEDSKMLKISNPGMIEYISKKAGKNIIYG